MYKTTLVLLLSILLGVSCFEDTCDNSVGPTPVPSDPSDPEPGPEDPYVRQDTEPDFYQVVGITAFSLAAANESQIRRLIEEALSNGYNTLRVGSETSDWQWRGIPGYLPTGPPLESQQVRDNLKNLLKVTATYPNLWVQVISSFTIKDRPMSQQKEWARFVASKVKGYKHVFLSAINEPHQSSYSYGEIIDLLNILRTSGRPVGVDFQAEGGHWRYPREVMVHVDYLAMHPRRNPDLSSAEIENVVRLNGLVLFDETTSYASDQNIQAWPRLGNHSNIYLDGHGTEKDRQRAAKQYMERFRKFKRARWFFHSIDLIRYGNGWAGVPWLPRWR